MKVLLCDHHGSYADYIRHARLETLKSLNAEPHPSMVRLSPVCMYLLAVDEKGSPIGMGEIALLADVYSASEETPYHHICDLNKYGTLDQLYGMRTIYVEPELRRGHMAFLALAFGAARLTHSLGGRFATASTRAGDHYLNALYEKCGGEHMGTFEAEGTSESSSLFVIDLEKATKHRAMNRVNRYVHFEFGEVALLA